MLDVQFIQKIFTYKRLWTKFRLSINKAILISTNSSIYPKGFRLEYFVWQYVLDIKVLNTCYVNSNK